LPGRKLAFQSSLHFSTLAYPTHDLVASLTFPAIAWGGRKVHA